MGIGKLYSYLFYKLYKFWEVGSLPKFWSDWKADMPYDFGYDQIGTAGVIPGSGDKMSLTAKVRKPGYLYIYVSTENDEVQEVYFDDLAIKHVKTPVIQGADYYAFGLQTTNSWMRENNTGNPYLYNAGSELNNVSALYETMFREYDPVLGRFHKVDLLAAKYSSWTPYSYAFNNAVLWNDPLGLDPALSWEDIMSIIDHLWQNGGGTWSRAQYLADVANAQMGDEGGPGGGGGGGGPCPGCNVFGSNALYEYGYHGGGYFTLYVTTGTSYYSNYGNMLGFSEVVLIDLNNNTQTANLFSLNFNTTITPGAPASVPGDISWLDVGAGVNAIFAAGIKLGTEPGQRPKYWGPNDFKNASRVGKTLAHRLSLAGAVISVSQAINNPTAGNIVDAVFGIVGSFPGYGTAIGAVYFGIDLVTTGITGEGISEHIDNYHWIPTGTGWMPVGEK